MSFSGLLKKVLALSWHYGGKSLVFLQQQATKILFARFRSEKMQARFPRPHFDLERGASQKGVLPKGALKTEQLRTLEIMPEEVKILYTRILAAQTLVDKQIHPLEFSDLYVFMAQIGLSPSAREQVRKTLADSEVQMIPLIDQLLAKVSPEEQEIIRFSIVKDLLRVSRMDGRVSAEELDNIRAIATHLYHNAERAANIMQFAERAIEYDEKLLMGTLTIDEFTKGAKNLAVTALSIGVPVTAVYFSGSVIGLSAAGIISGLTALGLGGILGLSSLVTGIGVVVVMGLVTFKLVKWVLTGKERQMELVREHMMQEIIKLNQQALVALAEDLNTIAEQMTHLASMSGENRKMLAKLHELYQDAMSRLHDREQQYVQS